MAVIKYKNPPQPPSGQNTFSDNLVGIQLVEGGGLTQGNFQFTQSVTEKTNRNFNTGVFSDPITLSSLGIENDFISREILEKNFSVYPNLDLSNVSNFSTFGSLTKRISTSVQKIINYFPAALDIRAIDTNFNSGITAYNISYNKRSNETYFRVPVQKIRNPFDIDFTVNSTRNISFREIEVSNFRDLSTSFLGYSLIYLQNEFDIVGFIPLPESNQDYLEFIVNGNPFSGYSYVYDDFYIKPNSLNTNIIFDESFDEVEKFLLNRLTNPIYSAKFDYPKESDDGTFYNSVQVISWPLDGEWNLDIRTPNFETYVESLSEVAKNMDEFKTNLVSRFLTTGAFKEFDTADQKVEKILQIYGRNFDQVKKFIDGLAYINSVNYNTGNDIPSELLKNLAQTLGWSTNISPISEEDFTKSIFDSKSNSDFAGFSRTMTPSELNYQFYRNLILNSSFLFKSKGTRKSIEFLLRLIGAPESLVEFNETIYLADGKINMGDFETKMVQISGGTAIKESVVLDPNNTFQILGVKYSGFTTSNSIDVVFNTREDYPVDSQGYPTKPIITDDFYFQKGAGWFEQTPQHRSKEIVDLNISIFTGQNPSVQTELAQFTYGEQYFDRFRDFPHIGKGFNLTKINDNKKSYTDSQIGERNFTDAGLNANYYVSNEKLVLNRKNVDIF